MPSPTKAVGARDQGDGALLIHKRDDALAPRLSLLESAPQTRRELQALFLDPLWSADGVAGAAHAAAYALACRHLELLDWGKP